MGNVVLAHFDGTNGSTTFTNEIVGGPAITGYSSAALSTAQQMFGSASLNLTAASDRIQYGTVDGDLGINSGDFTFECWIRQSASPTGSFGPLLCNNTNTGYTSGIASVGSSIQFFLSTTGSSYDAASVSLGSISNDTWVHVSLCRSGNAWYGSIGGTVTSLGTYAGTIHNPGNGWYTGSVSNGTAYGFNGYIDDIRITTGTARYTSNFTPSGPLTDDDGVSGDLAATEAQDTSTITIIAVAGITVDIAATEAQDTFVASAVTTMAINGDFAVTEAPDTFLSLGGTMVPGAKVFAICTSSGAVGYGSIDGNTWTHSATPAGVSLNSIAYGDGKFVTVGNDGTILYSTDMVDWTTATSGISSHLRGISYGGGYFMAAGDSGKVLRSSDGITWTVMTMSPASNLLRSSYLNSHWIVGASGASVFVSFNATDWFNYSTGWNVTYSALGLTFGEGLYVATGYRSGNVIRISTSPDAGTWTAKTPPSALQGRAACGTYNGTDFILPWNDGASATPKRVVSATGASWASVANLPAGTTAINDCINAEGLTVAVGANSYIITSTGTTFTKITSPIPGSYNGICQGDLPATGGYTYGTLAPIEASDTCTINGTRIAVYTGDLIATESPDIFNIDGVSFAGLLGDITVTESPDEVLIGMSRDYADINVDFSLLESTDSVAITGQKVTTLSRIMRIAVTEASDITAIRVSSSVRGDIVATETPDTFRLATGNPGIVMAIQILQSSFDLIVTYGASLFDGGTLDIYSGNQVADPTVDPTGTLLGSIILPSPAFIEAEDGTATKDGDWEGAATASGVAGWFRLTSEDGNHIVDGSVSSGDGDGNLLMSATSLTIGDPLVVESAEFSFELQDEV